MFGFGKSGALTDQQIPAPPGIKPEYTRNGGSGLTGAQRLQIIGATLRDLGNPGGGSLNAITGAIASEREKAKREANLAAMAEKLGAGDETLSTLLRYAPEEALGALAKRYEPANLAGGSTRYLGFGTTPYTAPMLRFEGDQAITQSPEGIAITGTRNPSFAEQTARTQQETNAVLDRLRTMAQVERMKQQNALGWASFNERKRQGGFGTPGVGGVLGSSLDPDEWEIDQ